ncbi:hypothetical protein E2C01_087426 [Portunus trituberculatus]|uniref:Uncharacterized protein n=1 Tax=Portunus trituberculatus TaxID=210409 RepID=A0A5B7JDB9_PORTR|nr:hypothetical protein [Portunus trituberculatus]
MDERGGTAREGVVNSAQITAALMSGAVVATRDWEAVIKTKKLPHANLYDARRSSKEFRTATDVHESAAASVLTNTLCYLPVKVGIAALSMLIHAAVDVQAAITPSGLVLKSLLICIRCR